MAQITNFFLGANSGSGFQNLFSEIMDPETAFDIMILKGGPGEEHLHVGDRQDHGAGGSGRGVSLVLRGPGFSGRRGDPGAPVRRL